LRYYDIIITPPSGSKAKARQWSSYPKGLTGPFDPGALNIEFDVLVYQNHVPDGGSSITIEGIALEDLLQADQFGSERGPYWTIEVSGGMGPGLPLNNPKQVGLLFKGDIYQSFGNWQGTEMTLEFVLNPGGGTQDSPKPIVFNNKAGTPMKPALAQCFSTAFPGMKQQIDIGSNWVQNHDEVGYYHSLDGLAQAIADITDPMFPDIQGVRITLQNGTIRVSDGTKKTNPIQIDFLDLVGQPTWIEIDTMQIKMVMRGDLDVGSSIKLPAGMQNIPGFVQTTAASLPSSQKYKSTFQGVFEIIGLRHLGNFRSSDGAQWVTIATCVTPGAA
jgi:hypothetical protein